MNDKQKSAIQWATEVSARAQRLASAQQDDEFRQLLRDNRLTCCIGCGKEVEFIPEQAYRFQQGYYYGGGLLIDTMGWGSTKHDMAKVAVLVCDDCVETKGISSSWLDKLHNNFDEQAKIEPPVDFQI